MSYWKALCTLIVIYGGGIVIPNSYLLQADIASRREVEDRVCQLEAELNVVMKEKKDLEQQVAELRDECEAKQKVAAGAEFDKKQLIEANEHFLQTIESLNALLHDQGFTIQQLEEELGSTAGLLDRRNSELKAMKEALEESRELAKEANEKLIESSRQLQIERESQDKVLRKLKWQHQDIVAELKDKVKNAEDNMANSQAVLLVKEKEVMQVNKKLQCASQQIENLQVSIYAYT